MKPDILALIPWLLGAVGMPLPPELTGDAAVVVKAGSVIIGSSPPKLLPYRVAGLERGDRALSDGGVRARLPGGVVALELKELRERFSFRLEKGNPGAEASTLAVVGCGWAAGARSASAGRRGTSVGVSYPQSFIACRVSTSPDPGAPSWDFSLWMEAPSNPFSTKLSMGGSLTRGESESYDVVPTNVTAPYGIAGIMMTGVLFTKDGRPVAAVDRVGAGRIVLPKETGREEEALFASVGAAVLVFHRDSYRSMYVP